MSEQVSSFISTEIGNMKYLFYITSWNDFQTRISDILNENWEKFGEALGQQGKIIKPYDSANHKVFKEILSKKWNTEILKRMKKEQDPFMIITKVDFETFNPNTDEWLYIADHPKKKGATILTKRDNKAVFSCADTTKNCEDAEQVRLSNVE